MPLDRIENKEETCPSSSSTSSSLSPLSQVSSSSSSHHPIPTPISQPLTTTTTMTMTTQNQQQNTATMSSSIQMNLVGNEQKVQQQQQQQETVVEQHLDTQQLFLDILKCVYVNDSETLQTKLFSWPHMYFDLHCQLALYRTSDNEFLRANQAPRNTNQPGSGRLMWLGVMDLFLENSNLEQCLSTLLPFCPIAAIEQAKESFLKVGFMEYVGIINQYITNWQNVFEEEDPEEDE